MQVKFRDGSIDYYDDEPFASGGQGTLHYSKDKKYVIKLYHSADNARITALNKIIGDFNVPKQEPNSAHWFAWPNAIVETPKLGVRMVNVNVQLEHKALTWWIGSRTLKRLGPEIRGNWLDRVFVGINMARIAWLLHGNGLCHSDFSSDNFLVNAAQQHAVLIDLDSLVVPGVLPPEMLGTGDYMAPEIVMGRSNVKDGAKPTIETDLHSLSVLIYQLLLMRHPLKGPKQHSTDAEQDDLLALGKNALYIEDPTDRSNRPADPFRGAWLLGEEVEALMRRAFTVGLKSPAQRPLAVEWSDALIRMFDQTVPCSNQACDAKAFVLLRDKEAICPWCETKVARPAQVPIVRLYDSTGQRGHFLQGRARVVGWQNRTLNRWHAQTGLSASKPEDRTPVAEFLYKQSKWQLRNIALPDLRVVSHDGVHRVAVDEPIALEDGQRLLLGNGNSARLAVVAMQKL